MSCQTPTSRPRILVFIGRYLPGFNSGGPVRTLSSMVDALASHFDLYIVTLDRDSGSRNAYQNISAGVWNTVGMAQVFYVPRFRMEDMERFVREVKPSAVYFNGFFSTSTVLGMLNRRFGGFRDVPVVVATRGDLAAGALGLKSLKKRLYIKFARRFGLYRNVLWHASSEREKSEMMRELSAFGVSDADIHVVPDLGFGYQLNSVLRRRKVPGEARFVTIGRIVRMKNLPFTLDRLATVKGRVSLDILGPIEDRGLWVECERKISSLPSNISVRYHGAVAPASVIGELATRDFFILPTLGENYGHVIIEGLAAGCPVIISDRTQWTQLQTKQVGWDLSLDRAEEWESVLQQCVDMDEEQFQSISARAAEYGKSVMNSSENLQANVDLFMRALAMSRTSPEPPVAIGVGK